MTGAEDRTQFIGSSDVAAILGISPWKSALQLYMEKIGECAPVLANARDDARKRVLTRGKRWEPVVVEMLVDELQTRGHDVQILGRNARYTDLEFTFLSCEIDLELLVDGEQINAEIKTVHPFAAKAWGDQDTDEIPIYYAAQVMHSLMITGRQTCLVAALIGVDDLRIHYVNRDDETISAMRDKEVAFWRRVQDRNPPDPQTADDVRWLYAKDSGDVAEADDELLRLVSGLHYQKMTAKHAEDAISSISIRIKLAMGRAAVLLYNGKEIATWRCNKSSRKTDWKSVAEELCATDDVIERHTNIVAGNRPLILKL